MKMFLLEQIEYDEHSNVLYISSSIPPRSGIAEDVGYGVFVRIDPNTDELVGVTILDFISESEDKHGS